MEKNGSLDDGHEGPLGLSEVGGVLGAMTIYFHGSWCHDVNAP